MNDSQVVALDELAREFHQVAVDKGWYERERQVPELLCLIHSEVSELLEAFRMHEPQSDKVPELTACEEELADILIRCLDMAVARGWRVGLALKLKSDYNLTRPHRHGGKAI